MQCPFCKSDHVQKLRLIYESGTSDIYATSYGSTVGYSSGGGLYTGSTTMQTSGQSKTRAAQRASPPKKKPYKRAIICFALGVLLVRYKGPSWAYWTDILFGDADTWAYFGLILIAAALWLAFHAGKYNFKIWPDEYRNWTRSWRCNRCGNTYVS